MQNLTTQLPQRINAMKVISYDVQQVAKALMEEQEYQAHEITLEIIMETIEDWADKDFNLQGNFSDVIFQDENGEEIDA